MPSETDIQTAGAAGRAPSRPSSLKFRHILARMMLALVFVAGLFFSVIPIGRAATRALYVLPGVISASQSSFMELAAEPIQHIKKTIASSNGPVFLDIYQPGGPPPPIPGAREGVVVIPGVGDSRSDPQLVNFSESMARAGVVVMDMTTQTLLNYALSVKDADAVVQAALALARWPGVGAGRVGIIGFSAGDAPACFAAADARLRDRLAFMALFGGYFNTTDLLRDFGRRALDVDGTLQAWSPQYVPIQVLSDTIEPLLPSFEGQRLVNALAPGGTPFTPDELATFSTDTLAVYHLLRGDEPGRVDADIAALSPPIHALLDALSPSRVIGQIRAPIYLLHDRSDQYVPFTESRDFAAALARIHHPYDFAEVGIFQHVEVKPGLNILQILGDGASLLRFLDKSLLASV
jgi:pimeloyl-ACP methyl ester carboxylesterase